MKCTRIKSQETEKHFTLQSFELSVFLKDSLLLFPGDCHNLTLAAGHQSGAWDGPPAQICHIPNSQVPGGVTLLILSQCYSSFPSCPLLFVLQRHSCLSWKLTFQSLTFPLIFSSLAFLRLLGMVRVGEKGYTSHLISSCLSAGTHRGCSY